METLLKIVLLVLLVVILLLTTSNKKKYVDFINRYKKELGLPLLAPFALCIIDKCSIINRFPKLVTGVQQKMISLHGTREALNYTKAFIAQLVMVISLGSCLVLFFGVVRNGDTSSIVVIAMLVVLIPFVLMQGLAKRELERRQNIIFELPEFLNKVILLVNAGETAQKAFTRCALAKKVEVDDNPLYFELNETVRKMENNMPFPEALNQLSKKCALQEMSSFTTTLLLNYRKGGEELVNSLKSLSTTLWEKRKAQAQIKGEEASSKMILPLVIIFVIVMIIVGFPALAIM